jgi:hypothetical protein
MKRQRSSSAPTVGGRAFSEGWWEGDKENTSSRKGDAVSVRNDAREEIFTGHPLDSLFASAFGAQMPESSLTVTD